MEQLPKILESEADRWCKLGFQIVYVGQHPNNPDCAVYQTKDMCPDCLTGFPTVFLVHDNKYDEITGFGALKLLKRILRDIDEKEDKDDGKCSEYIKKQIIDFVGIAREQYQVCNCQAGNSSILLAGPQYFELGYLLKEIVSDAEFVIAHQDYAPAYEMFIFHFGGNMKRIKSVYERIKTLDPDWEKYLSNMNKICDFYDKLDKIENIQKVMDKFRQGADEYSKEIDKRMFADSIDMDLQNRYAKKFAEKIKEIIQKAKPGEIKMYDLAFKDDQVHYLLMKGKSPILYMTKGGVSPIDPMYDMLDPVKDAHYSFTICCQPKVCFEGDYETLEDLIKLMPEEYEYAPEEYILYIPSWQERGLTQYGLECALGSLNGFKWKK